MSFLRRKQSSTIQLSYERHLKLKLKLREKYDNGVSGI